MKDGEHAFATSPHGDDDRDVFVPFVGLFSGIPKMEVAAALHHSSGLRTSGPVYDQVHQEQFAAGEMSENLVGIPVCAGTGDRSGNSCGC